MKAKVYVETTIPSFYFDDPTITRIRDTRHHISSEHQHDPQQVVEYYIRLQKKYQSRLVGEQEEVPVLPARVKPLMVALA